MNVEPMEELKKHLELGTLFPRSKLPKATCTASTVYVVSERHSNEYEVISIHATKDGAKRAKATYENTTHEDVWVGECSIEMFILNE